jgi:dienelactone hydrolase
MPRVCKFLLIASLICLADAGCASRSTDNTSAAAVKTSASNGYVPSRHYETTSAQDTWTLDGSLVDVTLMVPTPGGPYPLVLYLPGLGEACDAGLSWRQAWARAGYAVLCVQPKTVGPSVWASSRARAGDFVGIARDAFSVPSLVMRTQVVRAALARVSRRGHDTGFAQVDLARIGIAGFDLGAQTALVVAGQHVAGLEPLPLPDGVKAVITLSPYADRAAAESLYQEIHVPVLTVTSGMDTDAYGLVGTPSIRRTPFQYMPAGRKYLLLLASAPHALFAGAPPAATRENKDGQDTLTGEDDRILGDETAEVYEGRPHKRRKLDDSASRANKLAQQLKVQRQVQAVTTAYLDAFVRNDGAAAQWLTQDATTWLGESAELEVK